MIFKTILFCSYLMLKLGLKITSLKNPSFNERLHEKDLSFVVTTKKGDVARLFKIIKGELFYQKNIDESINFTVMWNGWENANTLRKKLQLNVPTLLSTRMIQLKGDLSCLIYLFTLLGEMIPSLKKNQKKALQRAEFKRV